MGDTKLNREADRVEMPRGVNGRAFVRWRSLMKLLKPVLKSLHISAEGIDVQEMGDGGIHLRGKGGAGESKHLWEPYRTTVDETTGWAIYPATVNGTILPLLEGGDSIFTVPPPLLPDDTDFSVYLEYDVDADSQEASDGTFFLLSGSQELSNVNVTTSPGGETAIAVNPSTGVVTPGHYVYLLAMVVDGVVEAQPMRFSVYFNLCSGGGMTVSAYG